MRIGDLKYIGMTGYSVIVPHMGQFYVALRLLHVVNGVAPKPVHMRHTTYGVARYVTYRIWSGPILLHTTYGAFEQNWPYATYRIWHMNRMVHIALLANFGE